MIVQALSWVIPSCVFVLSILNDVEFTLKGLCGTADVL